MESVPVKNYTLSTSDVARIFGYHVQYVRFLTSTGRLPAIKRFREWMYDEQEIRATFEQLAKESVQKSKAVLAKRKNRV